MIFLNAGTGLVISDNSYIILSTTDTKKLSWPLLQIWNTGQQSKTPLSTIHFERTMPILITLVFIITQNTDINYRIKFCNQKSHVSPTNHIKDSIAIINDKTYMG